MTRGLFRTLRWPRIVEDATHGASLTRLRLLERLGIGPAADSEHLSFIAEQFAQANGRHLGAKLMNRWNFAAVILGFVAACGAPPQTSMGNQENIDAATTATGASAGVIPDDGSQSKSGFAYTAPADPKATYNLISVEEKSSGVLVAVTQRKGPSGVSYSAREIDCELQTFRYVGDGDTLEEALTPMANLGDMSELVEGSSSHAAVQAACANLP